MTLEAKERPERFTRLREAAEGVFLEEEDAARDKTDLVYDSIVQEALTGEKIPKKPCSLSTTERMRESDKNALFSFVAFYG